MAWLVVYLCICLTGQRFITPYLNYGWQIIPWDILSSDPLRSVWYLHVQPPLWNLTIGAVAWISPASDAITLQVVLAGFGAVACGWAVSLARELGLRPGAALGIGLLATLNPEVVRNAFEPTYELPVAALLLGTVLWAARWASGRHGARAAVACSSLATAVILTRSLYHPLWLVGVLALTWWVARAASGRVDRRTMAIVVLIPLLLVGGWMGKNQVLYGRATLSSWFGMNLQRAVIPVLDLDDLQDMHAAGQVSDVAMIGPFGNIDLYRPYEPAASCVVTGTHRSVTEPWRTTDPVSPNFNYECYLPIFDQAGEDAMAVIREHPEVWLEGRMWSARVMFAVALGPGDSPSSVMRGLDGIYSLARIDYAGAISTTGWGTPIYGSLEAKSDFGLLQVGLYLASVGLGLRHLVQVLRRRRFLDDHERARSTALALAGVTVLFTFVVGVVGELGEQARFRTMTDALVWVTVLSVLARRVDGWGADPAATAQGQASGPAR